MSNPVSKWFKGVSNRLSRAKCAILRQLLMPYEITDIVSHVEDLNACLIKLLPDQTHDSKSKKKRLVTRNKTVMNFLTTAETAARQKSDEEDESESIAAADTEVVVETPLSSHAAQILNSVVKKLKREYSGIEALSAKEIFELVAEWQKVLREDKYVKTLRYRLGALGFTLGGLGAGFGIGYEIVRSYPIWSQFLGVMKPGMPAMWVAILVGVVVAAIFGYGMYCINENREELKNQKNLTRQAELRGVNAKLSDMNSTFYEMWEQMLKQKDAGTDAELEWGDMTFDPYKMVCMINNLNEEQLTSFKEATSPQDLKKQQGVSRVSGDVPVKFRRNLMSEFTQVAAAAQDNLDLSEEGDGERAHVQGSGFNNQGPFVANSRRDLNGQQLEIMQQDMTHMKAKLDANEMLIRAIATKVGVGPSSST